MSPDVEVDLTFLHFSLFSLTPITQSPAQSPLPGSLPDDPEVLRVLCLFPLGHMLCPRGTEFAVHIIPWLESPLGLAGLVQ